MVARRLGRYAVGIELKPEYQSLIQDRCREQPGTVYAA
jgi:hypothetical protein